MHALVLLALTGCGGPNEETLVDELRVLSMIADPPEATPGATVTLDTLVVDPAGEGADVLIWSCTDLGDGCVEPAFGLPFWTTAQLEATGTVSLSVTVPAALAPAVTEEAVPLVGLYALACTPGTCAVVDDALGGNVDVDVLADPFGLMEELPITGTSLATRRLDVSASAEPHLNPVVTLLEEPVPGETVTLAFELAGETGDNPQAWGYATGGGFDAPSYAIEDGAVTLTWAVPAEDAESGLLDEGGGADVWVVFNDDLGGAALWAGRVQGPTR